jgi:hypothetical protein
MAFSRDDLPTQDWAIVATFLPSGWAEMARTTGALRRARDFPDAETLLRVLLLHVANGYSLAETAVRARQLGVDVSAVAIFKRLQASEEWLRWLAVQERSQKRVPGKPGASGAGDRRNYRFGTGQHRNGLAGPLCG